MAAGRGGNGRQGEERAAFSERGGLLGLAAASSAIALAVSEPPSWLDRNAYSVAISGLFFAGVTQVVVVVAAASVSAPTAGGRGGAAGRKLFMYASLVVAAGLAAAASLLL
ncbi:hypothetical protein PVAP13_5KG091600 [Panicum virgatum]|uniref:Uncharacterized protein n=1 Tax=Panicum virgatum TaxID=38727 RepID=A0A8T0S972_PANVG|nr:hypothetical protein PVAP13_5KG091600 [Panicum virgatum]